ncbi:MAG: tetratricopeptide repeat protein [Saprospirales bacterium]|nr:tetratricopeptide repeat protein [Saprospirales bacterium]
MKPFLTCLLALCLNAVAVAQSPVTIDLFLFGPCGRFVVFARILSQSDPFRGRSGCGLQAAIARRQRQPGKSPFPAWKFAPLSGFHEKSEILNREAYDLYYGLRGMEDDTCAMIFGALVESLIRTQKWEEAESLIAQALSEKGAQTTLSEYGKTLLLIAQGRMHHQRRRYKEALDCYQLALQTLERMGKRYGQEYPWLLYYAGAAEESSGRYEEARSYMRQCFETWEALLGKGHTATVIPNLAVRTLENDNDLFSVRDQYLEALGILEEKLGADARVCGIFHYHLTGVYFDLGKYDQAEYHLNLALDGSEKGWAGFIPNIPCCSPALERLWSRRASGTKPRPVTASRVIARANPHQETPALLRVDFLAGRSFVEKRRAGRSASLAQRGPFDTSRNRWPNTYRDLPHSATNGILPCARGRFSQGRFAPGSCGGNNTAGFWSVREGVGNQQGVPGHDRDIAGRWP